MSLVKRLFIHLTRIKKNIVILGVLMVVSVAFFLSISVYVSSKDSLDKLRESFGGSFKASVYIDWNNSDQMELVENADGSVSRLYVGPQVDQSIVDAITTVQGIKGCNAEIVLRLYAPGLKLVLANSQNLLEAEERNPGTYTEYQLEYWKMSTQKTSYIGCINSEYSQYFRNGDLELIEGRHIVEGDREKILISETVSEFNDINIGDTIFAGATAAIIEGGAIDDFLEDFQFEVVGIYKVNSKQDITYYTPEYDVIDNFIFTDLESMRNASLAYSKGKYQNYDSATFFVEDPKEIDSIIAQVKELDEIKGKPFQFDIDDTVYQESASILKTLNLVLTILIAVIIISCLAILSIILTMWIQNRRREAGILLSIGIERREIIAQFMAECLIIGLIAVVLAAGVSSAISKPVSNAVLSMITPEEEEIETKSKEELTQELLEGNFDNLGGEIHTEVKLPEEFNSTVTIGDVLLVLLIESILIIVTVYLACYRVLWMKPKDILTMMS